MMNFMSGRPGFYEEITTTTTTTNSRGMSSSASASASASSPSSSSSSSLHHASALPPYATAYHNYQQQQQETPSNGGGRGGDDEYSEEHNMLQMLRRGGEGSSAAIIEREHMFDKVVTPSDVGKLNRLVIPKQHAEKYFPLDSSTNEKGLLLNFEDRNGKPWRFRYSYWNSSQSYVMTKGWSRFVKEKKLDAGDIVSFQRGVGELGKDRLFIDWRRRPDAPELPPSIPTLSIPHQFSLQHRSSIHSWNPLFLQPPSRDHYSASHGFLQANPISAHHHMHHHSPYGYSNVVNGNPCPPGSILYLRSTAPVPPGGGIFSQQQQTALGYGTIQGGLQRGGGAGGVHEGMQVFESVPVVQGKAAAKRLRLFGVNMDCPISESDECDVLLPPSSTTTTTTPAFPQYSSIHRHQYYQLLESSSNLNNSSSSSVVFMNDPLQSVRPNYGGGDGGGRINEDKGKGSMSLDLDI